MRLINADALKEAVKGNGTVLTTEHINYLIDNAPTVEQEWYITGAQWNEFMKEHKRPHGEWILIDDVDDPLDRLNRYKCSECGRVIRIYDGQTFSDYPFCHCGAKMKGGAE